MSGRTRKSTFIKTFLLEKIKYSLVILNQTFFYIKTEIRVGWILLVSVMKGALCCGYNSCNLGAWLIVFL